MVIYKNYARDHAQFFCNFDNNGPESVVYMTSLRKTISINNH